LYGVTVGEAAVQARHIEQAAATTQVSERETQTSSNHAG